MSDDHSGDAEDERASEAAGESPEPEAPQAPAEQPEYTVYKAGGPGRLFSRKGADESLGKGGATASASSAPNSIPIGESDGGAGSGPRPDSGPAAEGEPEYKVYKGGRSLRKPDVGAAIEGLRQRGSEAAAARSKGRSARPKSVDAPAAAPSGGAPPWRKALRFVFIGAGLWVLLSLVLFAASAQIQKGKLADGASDELSKNFTPMLFSGETILVMGTDARPEGTDDGGSYTESCVDEAAKGESPSPGCQGGFRSDTLMLVRAGGGAFEKLSIPRDTYAEIPGFNPQKINAAYALGGAQLQIAAVENFLGIDIDHAVIIDFAGFAEFIDSIGGVEVALNEPVYSKISGGSSNGGITLKLDKGRHTLDGQRALALARVRENNCPANRKNCNNSGDDTDRARRQQLILAGIKERLTSITRLPYNFVRGPWIAWNAPKAMVTDMGALQMPQLALSAAIGGDSGTKILKPSADGPLGSLVVSQKQCGRAVRKLLGGKPENRPACSPGF